jgi:hypothetical protein
MIKELRHFEVVCQSCNTHYYIDFRLPRGVYNLNLQKYGNKIIMRFGSSDCPFCIFDEDFAKEMEEKDK